MKICAVYKVLDVKPWLEISLKSIINQVDNVFIWQNEYSWNGKDKADELLDFYSFKFLNESKERNLLGSKITVKRNREVLSWRAQMQQLLNIILEDYEDCWYLYIDSDEIYEDGSIEKIKKFIDNREDKTFCINIHTYWKSIFYRIDPLEPYKPTILFKPTKETFFMDIRKIDPLPILIPKDVAMMHHFSYVLEDTQILKKVKNLRDSHLILYDWYQNVWKRWKPYHKDLHPVIPVCFKRTKYVDMSLPVVVINDINLLPNELTQVF